MEHCLSTLRGECECSVQYAASSLGLVSLGVRERACRLLTVQIPSKGVKPAKVSWLVVSAEMVGCRASHGLLVACKRIRLCMCCHLASMFVTVTFSADRAGRGPRYANGIAQPGHGFSTIRNACHKVVPHSGKESCGGGSKELPMVASLESALA